ERFRGNHALRAGALSAQRDPVGGFGHRRIATMNESAEKIANLDAVSRPSEDAAYVVYGQVAEEVNACLRAGREPDVEALIAPHPELGTPLREMVAALVMLHQLGHVPQPGPDAVSFSAGAE